MIELTVNDLHLNYGTTPVLKGVSLTLHKGEVVSLLGPSGSGKTTLLRAVAGLESPHQGQITIGRNVVFDGGMRSIPVEARNLGLVFQSYALWAHMTVANNIAYSLKLRKVARTEIDQRVAAVLAQLGLAGLSDRYPHELSGGQQQRVAIGRALVYNPPVLLLDEPLSNLDAKLREEARIFMRQLIVDLGLSALMVTHDQSEAMAISDRILLLNQGKIEQEGTPEMMYGAPNTLFTAEFMGSNNLFTGRVMSIEGEYACIGGTGWQLWGKSIGPLVIGQVVSAVARVEQVRLSDEPCTNSIPLVLQTSLYLGHQWAYVFKAEESDEFPLPQLRAYGTKTLAPGVYHLTFDRDKLWLFV